MRVYCHSFKCSITIAHNLLQRYVPRGFSTIQRKQQFISRK